VSPGVHGGPNIRTPMVLNTGFSRFAPIYCWHPTIQPHNLAAVAAARAAFPVRCGWVADTAFHRDHPWVNDTFRVTTPTMRKGDCASLWLHSLSYDYITSTLARSGDCSTFGQWRRLRRSEMVTVSVPQWDFPHLSGLPMGTRSGPDRSGLAVSDGPTRP
jgi:acetate kinase